MGTVSLVLMVVALVAFIIAAANISFPKVSFVALGLALWVLASILGGIKV